MYTLPCVKQKAGEKLLKHRDPSQVFCDDQEGGKGGSRGRRDVYNYG